MAIAEITTALSSLSAATKILKSILAMNKDVAVNQKIIELQNVILTLQSHINSMHIEYNNLSKIKDEIKKELVKHKDWNKTKSQYKLKKVAPGVFVYSPQENKKPTELDHWLCANCFNDQKKSILQLSKYEERGKYYFCQKCEKEIFIPSDELKRHFDRSSRDFTKSIF